MVSSPHRLIARSEMRKPPQFVVEGHAPANYGVTPADPAFIAVLQRAVLQRANEPEFVDNDFGGTIDRTGVVKTRDRNRVTLRGRLRAADLPLLQWACHDPAGGAGTAAESRTFMSSYIESSGSEVYEVWKGCLPLSCSITVSSTDTVMVEIEMSAQRYYETVALADAFAIGNGRNVELDPPGVPLVFKDIGSLMYDSRDIPFRSCTVTCTWTHRVQDSSGSEYDVYREVSSRRISGTFDTFKLGLTNNIDAIDGDQREAYLILQERAGNDARASRTLGTWLARTLVLESIIPGAFGNGIRVSVDLNVAGAPAAGECVIEGLTVLFRGSGANLTRAQIEAALAANVRAAELVRMSGTANAGDQIVNDLAAANLVGGTDADSKIALPWFRWLPSNEDLIDSDEATMESKSFESDKIQIAVGA